MELDPAVMPDGAGCLRLGEAVAGSMRMRFGGDQSEQKAPPRPRTWELGADVGRRPHGTGLSACTTVCAGPDPTSAACRCLTPAAAPVGMPPRPSREWQPVSASRCWLPRTPAGRERLTDRR
ncbi:hypothetical protein AAFF_G00088360 [Aldrovandia affinis]|uniref:Uncharacterized protein n=1 Tax=Aldrovandia affinis TaxID=143900 RepID=A0AAD7WD31_9TELE|nr:hypothetical protein AAFF_G00088360 [Aldrovandia affinis]